MNLHKKGNARSHVSNASPIFWSVMQLMVIPVFIVLCTLCVYIVYNYSNNTNLVRTNTTEKMVNLSKESDSKIELVLRAVSLLGGNPAFVEALENADYAIPANELMSGLKSVKQTFPFVGEVYILNPDNKLVFTDSGSVSFDDFFNTENVYQNYDCEYWNSFRFYASTEYRILSPSIVKRQQGNDDWCIPIVFRRIGGLLQKNLIVFDFNLAGLGLDDASDNSKLYVLNKITKEVFGIRNNVIVNTDFSKEFTNKVLEGKSSFMFEVNGDDSLIVTHSSTDNLNGYTYFAVISKKVLTGRLMLSMLLFLIILIFLISFTAFLIYRFTKHISSPIDSIINVFYKKSGRGKNKNMWDEFLNVGAAVQTTVKNLSYVLPAAQENYLINLLNGTEYYLKEDTKQAIEDSLSFPYDLFAVIIIQLSATSRMFDKYDFDSRNNIQLGFYNIIKELFASEFTSFVMPNEQNALYIILNMAQKDDMQRLDRLMNTIYSFLNADLDVINLSVGKSNVHEGVYGLKKAHKEATDTFSPYNLLGGAILIEPLNGRKIDFDAKDENNLFIALSSFNKSKIYSIIEDLCGRNKDAGDSDTRQLYNYILNVVLKVMRIKKISYKDSEPDFEIISECLRQPIDCAYRDMMILVDYFLKFDSKHTPEHPDEDDVVRYIDKNYCFSEMSLDFLANYFHNTTYGISKMIKGSLGVGFSEYLNSLRIEKAKQLLAGTDKTAQQICDECGFGSRQTFFRLFKSITGMTGEEWRNRARRDIE